MKVAGAYWRGDIATRCCSASTAPPGPNEKDLKAYLTRLEEAEKRDHRKIGREMDLFHMQEEAPGAVFWHPKGWGIFQRLIGYMRAAQEAAGFQEVKTPEIMDRRPVGAVGPLGEVRREHVHDAARPTSRSSPSSR
jgi:threonyl-tRNA synthetase